MYSKISNSVLSLKNCMVETTVEFVRSLFQRTFVWRIPREVKGEACLVSNPRERARNCETHDAKLHQFISVVHHQPSQLIWSIPLREREREFREGRRRRGNLAAGFHALIQQHDMTWNVCQGFDDVVVQYVSSVNVLSMQDRHRCHRYLPRFPPCRSRNVMSLPRRDRTRNENHQKQHQQLRGKKSSSHHAGSRNLWTERPH